MPWMMISDDRADVWKDSGLGQDHPPPDVRVVVICPPSMFHRVFLGTYVPTLEYQHTAES